jgi:phospholipase C
MSPAIRALPFAFAAFALSACGANGGLGPATPLLSNFEHRASSSAKIQHVVVIVQENRSFNDLFYGFPGAKTARYGYIGRQRVKLLPVPLETTWDIDHGSGAFFAACNGTGSIPGTNCRMNGFNKEQVGCGQGIGGPCPIKHPQYAYAPYSETKPLFDIAKQYVLADRIYASNFDGSSFVSHQYIIAGQSESAVNYPFSLWGCPGGPGDKVAIVGQQRQIPQGYEVVCWDPTTLGDELDSAGVSWAFYTSQYKEPTSGFWSAYQAIKHIYKGADWKKDVITPQTNFFDDVTNGKLRAVSWITPTFANSDHAGNDSKTGPSWVTSLVNAIGESQYWDSTAIFVLWDDYGGWYDSEPPAYVDYDGLGVRLPMLVVSAYAKKGHVSHVHFEHGTILKFIEDQFGLGRLAASDMRANPPDDAFDFSQAPRKFVPFQAPYGRSYFLHQPPDGRIPDPE